jgi:transposase
LQALEDRIEGIEKVLMREHKANPVSKRLATIPGIGPITASAIAATIADPTLFKSGRDLAAWIGLVPKPHSSGGKEKLGGVSKQGDRYLRRLLTVGATAAMRHLKGKTDGLSVWIRELMERRLGGDDARRDVSCPARSRRGRASMTPAGIKKRH